MLWVSVCLFVKSRHETWMISLLSQYVMRWVCLLNVFAWNAMRCMITFLLLLSIGVSVPIFFFCRFYATYTVAILLTDSVAQWLRTNWNISKTSVFEGVPTLFENVYACICVCICAYVRVFMCGGLSLYAFMYIIACCSFRLCSGSHYTATAVANVFVCVCVRCVFVHIRECACVSAMGMLYMMSSQYVPLLSFHYSYVPANSANQRTDRYVFISFNTYYLF